MSKSLKILVVRFSSIGDIVLTTPIIRILKKQLNAEVHYLTRHSYSSLLKNNPNIDQLFSIKNSILEIRKDLKDQKATDFFNSDEIEETELGSILNVGQ